MTSFQLREYDPKEFLCIPEEKGDLGSGSFAVVRLALHQILGPVALKCYSMKKGKSIQHMFENEVALQHGCNNDHVVRVYGYTKWKGAVAIVMEYCNYGNLEDILKNLDVELPVSLILQMCTEVARGLSSVHNFNKLKRLIHCDVKTGNILVSKDFHCKLSDFGGAKLCSYTNAYTSTENPKRDQFTVAYLAPEVLKDPSHPLSKEQDAYSFGMMLYTMLVRRRPFTIPREVLVAAVKSGSRPNTDKIKQILRKRMDVRDKESIELMQDVMEKCWKQDPRERPNMLEIKECLEKQLAKYKQPERLVALANVMQHLDISDHVAESKENIPLDKFSPESNTFVANWQPQMTSPFLDSGGSVGTISKDSDMEDIFKQNVDEACSKFVEYTDYLTKREFKSALDVATHLLNLIMSNKFASADDLEVYAEKQSKLKNHVLATLLYYLAGVLHQTKINKTCALDGITRCCVEIGTVSEEMIKSCSDKKSVLRHNIPLMQNLTELLQLQDVPNQIRQNVGWCITCMQRVYVYLKEWEILEDCCRKSIRIAENTLGEMKSKYRFYGHFHYHLGHALRNQKKFAEASELYRQAVQCYRNVDDVTCESEIIEDIKNAKKCIQLANLDSKIIF